MVLNTSDIGAQRANLLFASHSIPRAAIKLYILGVIGSSVRNAQERFKGREKWNFSESWGCEWESRHDKTLIASLSRKIVTFLNEKWISRGGNCFPIYKNTRNEDKFGGWLASVVCKTKCDTRSQHPICLVNICPHFLFVTFFDSEPSSGSRKLDSYTVKQVCMFCSQ